MTVIAASHLGWGTDEPWIAIAADRQSSFGETIRYGCKIGEVTQGSDTFVFAGAGYSEERVRMERFLRNHGWYTDILGIHSMILDFHKEYRDLTDSWDDCRVEWIFVVDQKIFHINGFDVIEVPHFEAIGSGEQAALAVMHAHGGPLEAVRCACKVNKGCGGQIDYWKISPKGITKEVY